MDNWTWTDELVLEFVRYTKEDAPAYQGRYADLKLFKQSKQNSNKVQPLFKTVDGKNIYEGDEYWILFIESGSSWIPYKTKASEHTIADVTKSYMKRFSTEELAKEYAIMHKPCLSLDDLLSAWGDGDGKPKEYYANAPLFLNFKRLVNEKLNAINR